MMAVVLGLMLTACSSANKGNANKEEAYEPKQTTAEMVEAILGSEAQRPFMDLEADMVKELYHIDPTTLEEYTIKTPMMNISTNEIAVIKVKDEKDVATVETALKQRATDVQKQFEQYLQDQYENAKNYKLITKGKYVYFAISEKERVDKQAKVFEDFFVKE